MRRAFSLMTLSKSLAMSLCSYGGLAQQRPVQGA